MEGTIIRIISNLYTVKSNNLIYECRARGKFRNDKIIPLVGDKVIFDEKNNYILEIKPRINCLDRPMIANIDAALIVTSVKKPDLSLNLLDKELSMIISNKIIPIIVLTKIDLLNKTELKQIKNIKKYYNSIGINTITNKEMRKLKKLIKNKTLVLTGQSGAGKSTLMNLLDKKLNLETNEISEALGRGKHTTRHVELFDYKTSLLADTPGFSSLDIQKLSKEQLRDSFIEFNRISCPFKNCMHINEKECNVKNDVNNKNILKSRYDNYVKFEREL